MPPRYSQAELFAAHFPAVRFNQDQLAAAFQVHPECNANQRAAHIRELDSLSVHPALTTDHLALMSGQTPEWAINPPQKTVGRIRELAEHFEGTERFVPVLAQNPWLLAVSDRQIQTAETILDIYLEKAQMLPGLRPSILRQRPEFISAEPARLRAELAEVVGNAAQSGVSACAALEKHFFVREEKPSSEKELPAATRIVQPAAEVDEAALTRHADMVKDYMRRKKVSQFSTTRYRQALSGMSPSAMAVLCGQTPEQIRETYDHVVHVLKPHRFTYSLLGVAVENGFTPSLWKNFASEMTESCSFAVMLEGYTVSEGVKCNPATFLRHALADESLRQTPANTLRRKLDEARAFNMEHGASSSSALGIRMRYPEAFHIGGEEIEQHLKAMQDCYGAAGYNRDAYLKKMFKPGVASPRTLCVTPENIRAYGDTMLAELGPYGLTRKAWLSVLMEYPFMGMRTPEENMGHVNYLQHFLDRRNVPDKAAHALYAKNPKLLVRDPSAITERADSLHRNFGPQGMSMAHIIKGMELFPAMIRKKTAALVSNIAGMASYLDAEGVDAGPYFKTVANWMGLVLVLPERQRDNHVLVSSMYHDGLLAAGRKGGSVDPRVQALSYGALLAHTGEDLAIRRVWAKLCSGGQPCYTETLMRLPRQEMETGIREKFGEQANMRDLVRQELDGLEQRLGIKFSALTYGDASSGRRSAPVKPGREAAPGQLATVGPA